MSKSSSHVTAFKEDYVKPTNLLDFPLNSLSRKYPDILIYTHGSCNGLILMRTRIKGENINLCLWNPSTKQFKIIELDSEELKYGPADNQDFTKKNKPVVTYGLSYNCDTNDYKIVKAIVVDGYEYYHMSAKDRWFCYGTEVQVYTLGSDSWKLLPNIVPYEIVPYSTHAFVNGALHWLATPCPYSTIRQSMLIVSFDIGGENFREILLGPLTYKLKCSSSSVFVHQKPAEVSQVYRISGRQYGIETYVESLASISGGTYAGEPTDLQKQAVSFYLVVLLRASVSQYVFTLLHLDYGFDAGQLCLNNYSSCLDVFY
ncbi:uncharacterized protein LOC113331915 [Papaver somniferum]|uniref:uncharacterized protein LOC113331915 n=1 Tax=Papaver somniferum TaxID=3469 RepID=UPI000E6F91F9|nr:uncharacterized protein LOC113331915 [Papaver somniferum]